MCCTMAIDENYRGMGIGHQMFDFIKEIKKEKNLDGIIGLSMLKL